MKKISIYLLLFVFGFMGADQLKAQSYFGYQTIGVHTWFFSISWQGQKAFMGMGYNLRAPGTTFTDWQLEWRFPVQNMYQLDDHEMIIGLYKPFRQQRTLASIGVHARIRTQKMGDRSITTIGLNTALIPTYVFAASLTDGLYGTMGLRLAYQPILAARIKTADQSVSWQPLVGHRVELGGHLDGHIERTLGLAVNGFMTRTWFFKEPDKWPKTSQSWQREGDLYLGTTYYLKRW